MKNKGLKLANFMIIVDFQNRVNTLENQLIEIREQQRLENQRLNKERDNAIGLLQQASQKRISLSDFFKIIFLFSDFFNLNLILSSGKLDFKPSKIS